MTAIVLAFALALPGQLPPPVPVPPEPIPFPLPMPAAPPLVVPLPPAPPVLGQVATTAMTLDQFGKHFKPCEGVHTVWILHPKTGEPKPVCFALPAGTPKIKVTKLEINIDYGKYEAEVRFTIDGRVRVEF